MSEKTLIERVNDFSEVNGALQNSPLRCKGEFCLKEKIAFSKKKRFFQSSLKNTKKLDLHASERVRVNERARGELSHVTELTRSQVKPIFLSNLLIKMAIEKTKKERNITKIQARKLEFLSDDKSKSYTTLKKDRDVVSGGYGTISKSYGGVPRTSYVDYGKLFNYLGKFKSQSPYENIAEHLGVLNKAGESGSFTLVDNETMEKGARYVRYFSGGQDMNTLSLVPMAGMNSAEWEQFKLFMKLEPVMYRLKTSTS